MDEVTNNKKSTVLLVTASIILLAIAATLAFAQGGTGRAASNTNSPKKTPARKAPTKRTSRSSQPSSDSQPQPTDSQPSNSTNPNSREIPAPTPAPVEAPPAVEPNLTETLDWIGTALVQPGFYRDIYFVTDENLVKEYKPSGSPTYSATTCTLTLTGSFSETRQSVPGWDPTTVTYKVVATIPFADITLSSVRADEQDGTIQLKTTGNKHAFKIRMNNEETTTSNVHLNWEFGRYRHENMPRLEKAIKRAVQLCGGKSDPF